MKNDKNYVLIADDEKEIRSILKLLLVAEGYEVIEAQNGKEAAEFCTPLVDLVLLDINMPVLTGIMVASQIREKFDIPIIFLTAYSSESDKVMGFSVGADDYIVKPFSNVELLLRVKANLRRNQKNEERAQISRVAFQDAFLNLDSQSIVRGKESIPLTCTEFKILQLFVTHKKKIYSLDNIYRSVWEDDAVGDSTIMVHIKNIRKKLGDSSRNSKYIKTAWGRGYYVE